MFGSFFDLVDDHSGPLIPGAASGCATAETEDMYDRWKTISPHFSIFSEIVFHTFLMFWKFRGFPFNESGPMASESSSLSFPYKDFIRRLNLTLILLLFVICQEVNN